MIDLTNIQKIYLVAQPIDLRLGINTLATKSLSLLNTTSIVLNTLFIFINKRHNQIKAIEFDISGTWVYTKKLNDGKYAYPETNNNVFIITKDNLKTILEGLDFIVKIEGKTRKKLKLY